MSREVVYSPSHFGDKEHETLSPTIIKLYNSNKFIVVRLYLQNSDKTINYRWHIKQKNYKR